MKIRMSDATSPTISVNSKQMDSQIGNEIDYTRLAHTPPYLSFVLIFIIAFGIFLAIELGSQIADMNDKWSEVRCQPHVMPFAGILGHDTNENFQFCLQQIIQENTKGTTAPFAQGMMGFSSVLGNLMTSANSFRTTLASLTGGIIKIVSEFKARMTALMGRVKLTASRMKAMMYRIYGTMFAVMYMGISAQTGIANFGDTFIFKFIDAFCFDATTRIVTKSGMEQEIQNIKVGDILQGDSVVEAVVQCPGNIEGLYNLNGIYVSGGHRVWSNTHKRFVDAKDHPHSKKTDLRRDVLWTLITSNREIPVRGHYTTYRFADWEELPDSRIATTAWDTIAYSMLNNAKYPLTSVVPTTAPCIDPFIKVYMNQSGLTKMNKVRMGDWIKDLGGAWTQVIGICTRRVNRTLGKRGSRLTDGVWLRDVRGVWNHPTGNSTNDPWTGYQLITTSGSFAIFIDNDEHIIRDFTEVGLSRLEESYEKEDYARSYLGF